LPDPLAQRGIPAALATYSRTPGCLTCGLADVAFTMKHYVQTDLEAGRRVATTLAKPIIGGGPQRADIVMKSRAHQVVKKVAGPCVVCGRSLLPLAGAARPPVAAGS
jgi:hypothetical protein